jgi:hypothetical protein
MTILLWVEIRNNPRPCLERSVNNAPAQLNSIRIRLSVFAAIHARELVRIGLMRLSWETIN